MSSIQGVSHSYFQPQDRSVCLKVFVIFVVALGAITCVTGVLSLLASQGFIPSSVNSLLYLTKIGLVNSVLIIAGGFLFFIVGIVAWTCHLHQEYLLTQSRLSGR